MSDHINGIRSGSYRKEIIDTLQKLVKGMPAAARLSAHFYPPMWCPIPMVWKKGFYHLWAFSLGRWSVFHCFVWFLRWQPDSLSVRAGISVPLTCGCSHRLQWARLAQSAYAGFREWRLPLRVTQRGISPSDSAGCRRKCTFLLLFGRCLCRSFRNRKNW